MYEVEYVAPRYCSDEAVVALRHVEDAYEDGVETIGVSLYIYIYIKAIPSIHSTGVQICSSRSPH
jgi:hypothetical protein